MADSPSHNDIRQLVTDALAAEDKDKGDDLVVVDIGTDWVVYRDPDTVGAGLYRRGYKLDGGKAVLTSKPEKVVRTTSYEPASEPASKGGDDTPTEDQPKNLGDAAKETRSRFKPSADKSGDKK